MKYTEITSHEIACQYLGRDPNAMPDVSMRPESQQTFLINLIKLLDIGEAINKADGFVADWEDPGQDKWYPVFDGTEGFGFSYSNCDGWLTGASAGSRLCFRNEKISDFFGTQFNDLHKAVLTVKKP